MTRTLPAAFLAALLLPAPALGAGGNELRVEVVNRSGIPGLGHKAARFLRDKGFAVSSLDDTLRYDRDSTYLYYADGCASGAVSLARLIPGEQELSKAAFPLPAGVQIRLVIGADLARQLP